VSTTAIRELLRDGRTDEAERRCRLLVKQSPEDAAAYEPVLCGIAKPASQNGTTLK
jgi:hypothetical protein